MKPFITIFLLGTIIFMSACTASRPAAGTTPVPTSTEPRYDESFDPYTLDDEDIDFPESSRSGATQTVTEKPAPADIPVPEENQQVEGFRVQLFATNFIEKATLEKKEAEYLFAEDQVAVYVEFDSPMYKVRVGDCQTRNEAENLRRLARRKGYPTAFIVKTKVNTLPAVANPQEEPGQEEKD